MASVAAASGYVPFAVPGQVNIFAVSPRTKELEKELRQITHEVFNNYYKPTEQLNTYYHCHRNEPVVYIYREPSYMSYFSSTTIINNYGSSSSYNNRRSSDDDSSRIFLGLVGVVIAVVGGYLLGQEIKKHTLANDGLAAVKELKKEVKHKYTDESTKELLASGKRFFKKMERDSYTWIAIKTAVVAGGVLMAVGGFAAVLPVLAAGGILAALGLTAAAIRWGFSLGDDAKMSQMALRILRA